MKLTSFNLSSQVLALLGYTPNFKAFLIAIRRVVGASLYVHEDGTTSVAWKGEPIGGTRKRRFETKEELTALIEMAGLNK